MRDPGPSAKTGLLYPPEVGDIANFSIPLPLVSLSLPGWLNHRTESVLLYLQCPSFMLYTSCGIVGCLQSSGLTAGSPAAVASSLGLDTFGGSRGIVL